MATYFVLPMRGTPYHAYHIVENNEVVVIDISRPDGTEIEFPHGVRYKLRPIEYNKPPPGTKLPATRTKSRIKKEDEEYDYE